MISAKTQSATGDTGCPAARRRRPGRALPLALALLACGAALAQTETLYVTEQLVVSVSATPDGSGDRVGQIHSGDRVEVLERQGDQARVLLGSGQEGWVRASYLTAAPALREQLKSKTEELEKLRQQNTKLEAELATARKAVVAANAAASAPPASTPAAPVPVPVPTQPEPPETASMDPSPPASPPLFAAAGLMPARPSWIFALLASAAALIVGFTLGWRMLDRRIRAKYGGLRIY